MPTRHLCAVIFGNAGAENDVRRPGLQALLATVAENSAPREQCEEVMPTALCRRLPALGNAPFCLRRRRTAVMTKAFEVCVFENSYGGCMGGIESLYIALKANHMYIVQY